MIRNAQPSDVPAILELIRQLAIFEKRPDAVETTEAELLKEGFGENPLYRCFVAEINQEIVGIALFYYRFSTWKGRTIHLEDLMVKEEHRKSKIGTALFEAVAKVAKDEKVRRFEWEALNWNTPAINFYKKYHASIDNEWVLCKLYYEDIQKLKFE